MKKKKLFLILFCVPLGLLGHLYQLGEQLSVDMHTAVLYQDGESAEPGTLIGVRLEPDKNVFRVSHVLQCEPTTAGAHRCRIETSYHKGATFWQWVTLAGKLKITK